MQGAQEPVAGQAARPPPARAPVSASTPMMARLRLGGSPSDELRSGAGAASAVLAASLETCRRVSGGRDCSGVAKLVCAVQSDLLLAGGGAGRRQRQRQEQAKRKQLGAPLTGRVFLTAGPTCKWRRLVVCGRTQLRWARQQPAAGGARRRRRAAAAVRTRVQGAALLWMRGRLPRRHAECAGRTGETHRPAASPCVSSCHAPGFNPPHLWIPYSNERSNILSGERGADWRWREGQR